MRYNLVAKIKTPARQDLVSLKIADSRDKLGVKGIGICENSDSCYTDPRRCPTQALNFSELPPRSCTHLYFSLGSSHTKVEIEKSAGRLLAPTNPWPQRLIECMPRGSTPGLGEKNAEMASIGHAFAGCQAGRTHRKLTDRS